MAYSKNQTSDQIMKEFTIDEQYFCSVTEKGTTTITIVDTRQTIKDLEFTKQIDHPEFTKLREMLSEQGYIEIQLGWWNGDRVTKPFILNGMKFRKGDRFPCACAMEIAFKVARQLWRKTIGF
jgi:hypothetical protein